MTGVDVSAAKQPAEKAAYLRGDSPAKIAVKMQAEQSEPGCGYHAEQPNRNTSEYLCSIYTGTQDWG